MFVTRTIVGSTLALLVCSGTAKAGEITRTFRESATSFTLTIEHGPVDRNETHFVPLGTFWRTLEPRGVFVQLTNDVNFPGGRRDLIQLHADTLHRGDAGITSNNRSIHVHGLLDPFGVPAQTTAVAPPFPVSQVTPHGPGFRRFIFGLSTLSELFSTVDRVTTTVRLTTGQTNSEIVGFSITIHGAHGSFLATLISAAGAVASGSSTLVPAAVASGASEPDTVFAGFAFTHTERVASPATIVPVDILPRACRNQLRDRPGLFPVAILGTPEFDVTDVNVDTLLLNGIVPLDFDFEDIATCTVGRPDGFSDLLLLFDEAQLFQTLGPVAKGSVIPIELEGRLQTGGDIHGQDVVVLASRSATRDSDNDGVSNEDDQCPNSDLEETVQIDEHTEIPNLMTNITGCTIMDLIRGLVIANEGQFLDFEPLTSTLVADDVITEEEAAVIEEAVSIPDVLSRKQVFELLSKQD